MALCTCNNIATSQMHIDLALPFHDMNNYDACVDQNKSMGGNQSYLVVNSMTKALMAWLNNMKDMLTKDFDVVMQTFG